MNQIPDKHTGHYFHQISCNYRERIVGFFIFSGLFLFLFFVLISVKNQHLFEKLVILYIEVYEGKRTLIRTGAKALVNRLTNIGNALIEIKSKSIEVPILAKGATMHVEETPSLNDLLLGLASIIQIPDLMPLIPILEQPKETFI